MNKFIVLNIIFFNKKSNRKIDKDKVFQVDKLIEQSRYGIMISPISK